MKSRSETILLIGNCHRKEGKAGAGVSPGHLVVLGATMTKAGTAKLVYPLNIALENELLGGTINDAYATNDNMYYATLQPGDEAQVRIPANAGALIAGDYLEADATGCLRKFTDGVKLAQATEAVDNSAGATEAFINIVAL